MTCFGGYAGSAVRCGTMDSFDIGALASEPLVVFCVATAGKGEFCGNGRSSVSSFCFGDLQFWGESFRGCYDGIASLEPGK